MSIFDEDIYLQKANESWDDDYIKVISSLTFNDSDWKYLSRNPNITMDMVLNNVVSPHYSINPFDLLTGTSPLLNDATHLAYTYKTWDWKSLSANKNITFDMVLAYPNLPWDWMGLQCNPNLTFNDVLDHPEIKWNYKILSGNKNITLDIIISNPDKNWSVDDLSMNPNITMDSVKYHPEIPWDWGFLSMNNMKKGKDKYIKDKVYELKLIDEFRFISENNKLLPNVIENIVIEYL